MFVQFRYTNLIFININYAYSDLCVFVVLTSMFHLLPFVAIPSSMIAHALFRLSSSLSYYWSHTLTYYEEKEIFNVK